MDTTHRRADVACSSGPSRPPRRPAPSCSPRDARTRPRLAAPRLARRPLASVDDIGVATTLSGPFAAYGAAGLDGIKLAVAEHRLPRRPARQARSRWRRGDDQIDPATGETVTRNLILHDHVAALFGSVSSAVAAAQEQLAGQYKVPIFFHLANDVGLTTTTFNQYAFEFSPNTDMEPAAAALDFAKVIGHRPVQDRDDHARLQLRPGHGQGVPGRPQEGRCYLHGHRPADARARGQLVHLADRGAPGDQSAVRVRRPVRRRPGDPDQAGAGPRPVQQGEGRRHVRRAGPPGARRPGARGRDRVGPGSVLDRQQQRDAELRHRLQGRLPQLPVRVRDHRVQRRAGVGVGRQADGQLRRRPRCRPSWAAPPCRRSAGTSPSAPATTRRRCPSGSGRSRRRRTPRTGSRCGDPDVLTAQPAQTIEPCS